MHAIYTQLQDIYLKHIGITIYNYLLMYVHKYE